MGIRTDLEDIYAKRAESLRKLNTKQGKELADRIDSFLYRKRKGECVHQYYSLTFSNGAVYEFWAFENGWEGWKNYDYEYVNEDEVYIITQGTALVKETKNTYEICAGDTVLTKGGESHSIENIGDDDLKFIAIIVTY